MGEVVLNAAGYSRVDGALTCDGVPLTKLAESVGTPFYVYSAETIRERYARLTGALAGLPVHVHYSVKANSSLAILALLRSLGAGVDIVSGGELARAVRAGFSGSEIVFSGVGKTAEEITGALRAGVRSINVESEGELYAVQAAAEALGATASVAFRVNPDVAVETPHPYTRTGEQGMKFGIPHDGVVELARAATLLSNLKLVGLAAHVGSQISVAEPYAMAAAVLIQLKRRIESERLARIETLDVGGGLAVTYDTEAAPDLDAYARALQPLADEGVQILIEPGRFLVAEAGALVTKVVYRKHSGGQEIIVTDAGMNDLIRPSLYQSHHAVEPVVERAASTINANIVGPICESGDFFARKRPIPDVRPGELLALRTTGAYGYVMASNYNSRPRPPEVLVDNGRFAVVTARETVDDLTRLETLTPTWREG